MKTIHEIKELITPILEKYGITSAYLFGSYARGTETETSDIDLAVGYREGMTAFEEGALFEDLRNALHMEIDLVSFGSVVTRGFKSRVLQDMVHLFGVKYGEYEKSTLFE